MTNVARQSNLLWIHAVVAWLASLFIFWVRACPAAVVGAVAAAAPTAECLPYACVPERRLDLSCHHHIYAVSV